MTSTAGARVGSLPRPVTSSKTLADVFGPSTLQRGIDLFQRGRVLGLARVRERWEARVIGTAPTPYRVWTVVGAPGERADIVGGCNCPAPHPCKHIAAVVHAVLQLEDDEHGERPSARASATPRQAHAIERWAEQLERVATTAAVRESTPRKRELVFVLDVEAMAYGGPLAPRLAIEACAASLRRDGSLGRAQPYDLSAALQRWSGQRPEWIDERIYALWFRLQSLVTRTNAGYAVYGPRSLFPLEPQATAIFEELVQQATCRLGDGGPRLRLAAARPGEVQWQLADDGVQTLTVVPADRGAPWRVLPLQPIYYADPSSGACGPIALPVPDVIAPWLVGAPQVAAEASTRLPKPLRETLARWQVPAPQRLELAPARRGTPKPVLQLRARDVGGRRLPYASLAYDYDGTTIDPEDPRGAIVRVVGERFARIERDREAEMRLRVKLRELGLAGAPSAMTLPEPKDWIELVRSSIGKLRDAGWRVEIDRDFEWSTVEVDRWYVHAGDDARGHADDDDAHGHTDNDARGRADDGSRGVSDDGTPSDASDDDETQQSWFLELGVVIDGERVNILPAIVDAIRAGGISREQVREGTEVVVPLPDGRRVAIDPARLRAMLDVLVELGDDKPLTGEALQLGALDATRLDALGGFEQDIAPKLALRLDALRRGPQAIDPPRELMATLRDYQLHGLAWLQWLHALEQGGVLADDMGLGKTVQALADLLIEKQAGRLDRPALVVAPRSVLRNWQREAERFAPALRTALYHGPGRAAVLERTAELDLIITTYALLQRDAALARTPWHLAILDEAQAIKNPTAKVALAAHQLDARHRLCMTGTPMENNLGDLWSLMSFATPGLLGTSRQFTRWYRAPIERHGLGDRFTALLGRIAPFMLRRTKAAVLSELPPKTEVVLHADLDGPQRDLYESVRLTMEKRVREELAAKGLARSQIVVLDALLKLRQVCCHPPLVKLQAAQEVPRSAKLELLLELVGELVAEGRRALVFSQFTAMLAVIEARLDAANIRWLSITGKTQARQEIVDRFQAGEVPILLVSLKAGGTGLNLTRADTVIHYDPWWNPAVEAQATDRAHRIGQDQPVTVYRLICEGTVEERMLALQARKSALLAGVQGSAEQRARDGFALGTADIDALLAPIDAGEAPEAAPRRTAARRRREM